MIYECKLAGEAGPGIRYETNSAEEAIQMFIESTAAYYRFVRIEVSSEASTDIYAVTPGTGSIVKRWHRPSSLEYCPGEFSCQWLHDKRKRIVNAEDFVSAAKQFVQGILLETYERQTYLDEYVCVFGPEKRMAIVPVNPEWLKLEGDSYAV